VALLICLGLVLGSLCSDGVPADQPAGDTADSAPSAAATNSQPSEKPPEPADNSYCYVCHANYEPEDLTSTHQPVGVGCETCHGISEKHSGDEDGLTPPDVMYPKDRVNDACMKCHAREKFATDGNHDDVFFKDKKLDKICSECHAEEHRLKVRTRIWDKKTGKLISDDGVRMMYKDSPASGSTPAKAR
jgi:hypothetical protein